MKTVTKEQYTIELERVLINLLAEGVIKDYEIKDVAEPIDGASRLKFSITPNEKTI